VNAKMCQRSTGRACVAEADIVVRPSGLALGQVRSAAIIDIGSNSVRLVVYSGPARAMVPVFNEKLMAGLGASLASTGKIEKKAYDRALAGLVRFRALIAAMGIDDVRCVATAAVRDASNGDAFLTDARALGIDVTLLSGRDEARASGHGVISALPDADGIVADLGGGSLELVRVRNGTTAHHTSFPFGVLRLPALRKSRGKGFGARVANVLADAGWPGDDAGLPLYLVGGSWRALARYDMLLARDPMPVVSGHQMPVDAAKRLHRRLSSADATELGRLAGLTSARVATIPDASALLIPLVKQLKSSTLIVSVSGLREGLLFQDLPDAVRAQDPLLIGAAAEGARYARFAVQDGHGFALDRWIAPIFADDAPDMARLRLAACLLADSVYTANPDFRSERAVEMALHGQWLGIDLADRVIMAQTLYVAAGGQGMAVQARIDRNIDAALARATHWGLAIRLAQRLSGGAIGWRSLYLARPLRLRANRWPSVCANWRRH
jgi:exopolyphosphatase / guanosine-5'-triphosphate,3'-diphosphate pyrophosphatase